MNPFETWWKAVMNVEVFPLDKLIYPDGTWQYACHETNRAWLTWKAAIGYCCDTAHQMTRFTPFQSVKSYQLVAALVTNLEKAKR